MNATADQETVPNILVVDDTPANLRLLAGMLNVQGYRVRVAPSGPLAFKAIQNSLPDLVLVDVNMPEMDGYEFCRRLKADDSYRAIPVIFISALNETKDKVLAFQAGGIDYVTKPFQFAEVEARVSTHIQLHHYQQRLETMVDEKVRELADSQQATIYAMAKLAESRDENTGFHLERVRELCKMLAMRLHQASDYGDQLDRAFINNIFHASALHDIGKVGIADSILLKPGKLTPEEFEVMKLHTVIGAETLEAACERYHENTFMNMGVVIARSHHEKWDGGGYPDKLAGGAIPLAARIMALVDVYDALRSKRSYKEAFSREKSRQIIAEGAGTHFDPVITGAFLAIEDEIDACYEKCENCE
jgi:putative two-component system response regulator